MRNQPAGLQDNTKLNARWNFVGKGAAAVALALCLGSGAYAQQGQQNQNQQDQQQQQDEQMGPQQDQQQGQQGQPSDQQQAPPAQDAKTKPTYAPQDADKPPYSHDQNTPQRPRQPQMNQGRPAPATPSAPSAPNRPYQSQALPDTLTIPAGTILRVRMNDYLSSDKNQIGDRFTAELLQPLVVNGWVVATRGETLVGQVKSAKKAGRVKGTSELDLELTDLSVVDGRQLPILTQLWKGSGGTSHGADAATIAGGTGLGAAIGAAADWGTGAAIGAGAGAVAGIATVLLTRGRPTIVEPEMELTFRLDDPVTVDTTQSQQAFLPVTQRDYQSNGDHRRPRLAEGYPYPYPYYPYGYYGPYWYPGFVGIYGGGWWGPRYYGGWRGGFHR